MNYATALVQLPLVREPGTRLIRTPEDAALACADIASLAQESLHVLCLDVANRLINRHMVSLGTVDASVAHAREVFRAAVSDGASAVVLVHNHPSGSASPSAEDIRVTRGLVEAGRIMDIPVHDHVILGREGGNTPALLSLREAGICDFG